MTQAKRNVSILIACIVASLICAFVLCVGQAHAAIDPGVYTANVSATYANPDTGAIEDSGGESSEALGSSMVSGISPEKALVEYDGTSTTVSLRLGQADSLGDLAVSSDTTGSGAFGGETVAEKVQQNGDDNTAEFRFPVEAEDATLRLTMYVEPMGRNVIYFVKLSNFEQGNTAGYQQTLDESAIAAAQAAASQPASSASGEKAGADEAAPQAGSNSSAASGAKEYNADGHEVTGSKNGADAAEGLNYPLIIGAIAAIVVIVLIVVYFAVIRPKNAAQARAAAAASGNRSRKDQ